MLVPSTGPSAPYLLSLRCNVSPADFPISPHPIGAFVFFGASRSIGSTLLWYTFVIVMNTQSFCRRYPPDGMGCSDDNFSHRIRGTAMADGIACIEFLELCILSRGSPFFSKLALEQRAPVQLISQATEQANVVAPRVGRAQ
jgi:hypothetical protein